MALRDWGKLVVAIVVCEAAGIVGTIFTAPAIGSWYATLQKPALNPPAWVFGPVWTMLYFLMGVAAFLVWRHREKHHRAVRRALTIFAAQLALNTLWSIIFFGWHAPGFALCEILILWIFILASIISFAKISRAAAWLLAPYLAWVSFAAYLNYALWMLK